MLDKSQIIRSNFLASLFSDIIKEKGLNKKYISDKMKLSHSYISQNLSGKKVPSDNFFKQVGEVIGLTSIEMSEIFRKADKEQFKSKYGVEIMPDGCINALEGIDFDNRDLAKILMKKESGKEPTEEELNEIINFIKFRAKN